MKSITTWKPFGEFDRVFDDSFSPIFPKLGHDLAIDLYEDGPNVVARMNLPGMSLPEIDVNVENELLTISGRREEEHETDRKDYYSKEIRRGSFSRSIALPKQVDATRATATYVDGVLAVQLPIIAGSGEKAIKVPVT